MRLDSVSSVTNGGTPKNQPKLGWKSIGRDKVQVNKFIWSKGSRKEVPSSSQSRLHEQVQMSTTNWYVEQGGCLGVEVSIASKSAGTGRGDAQGSEASFPSKRAYKDTIVKRKQLREPRIGRNSRTGGRLINF